MKIYTKGGDKGQTSLWGGKRVSKATLRLEAYGTIDELNAHLGLLGDLAENLERLELIRFLQDRLFTIGALLAADPEKTFPNKPLLSSADHERLEQEIDRLSALLSPQDAFLLPGGHTAISHTHIARCVCRRAERLIVSLNEEHTVDPLILIFINRLSDYLFILARTLARELKVDEIKWLPRS